MSKRHIVVNPDEPRAGDFAFTLYDASHPIHGRPDVVSRLKSELRGLRGEEVTVRIRGARIDPDTQEERRFTVRRSFTMNRYSDVFGPGSAYHDAIRAIRDRHSNDELVVYSFDIETED
jgi:hypothetical protein